MTKTKRKAVAKTLREWAAWCEANRTFGWIGAWNRVNPISCFDPPSSSRAAATLIANAFCGDVLYRDRRYHRGPTAATGLLLAAAMIESGDEA
jgi:hypothetical protein